MSAQHPLDELLERIEAERAELGLVSFSIAVQARKPYPDDGVLVIHEDDGSVQVIETRYGVKTVLETRQETWCSIRQLSQSVRS